MIIMRFTFIKDVKMFNLIKWVGAGFLALVLLGSAGSAIKNYMWAKDLLAQKDMLIHINDSTQARVAQLKNENEGLEDAARTLRGQLVAALTLEIPAETVYQTVREVETDTVFADSAYPARTRRAVLNDTTESGIGISIEAIAPPYPANLQLGYSVFLPSFSPEVGFIEKDNQYFAVVSWGGHDFTVENPFFLPPKRWPLSLRAGAEAIATADPSTALGAQLLGKGYLALQYDLSKWSTRVEYGYSGQNYLSASVERVLRIPLFGTRR